MIPFSTLSGAFNMPVCNYVASNGSYSFRQGLGPVPLSGSTNTNNGMFGAAGANAFNGGGVRRIRDVSDGTSNTIAVGERCWELATVDYRAACMWGQRGSSAASGAETAGMVNLMAVGWRPINAPKEPGTRPTHRRGFSSVHPGGAQFVFVDGSVQFISENIDHNFGVRQVDSTFASLLAVDDGNVVGEY